MRYKIKKSIKNIISTTETVVLTVAMITIMYASLFKSKKGERYDGL